MDRAAGKVLSIRMAKLIRMQVSFTLACPFCMDMNSFQYGKIGISGVEAEALSSSTYLECQGFSPAEKLALHWVFLISQTPVSVSPEILKDLKNHFSDREITVMRAQAGKVNFWGRLMQACQIPPAVYSDLDELDKFRYRIFLIDFCK